LVECEFRFWVLMGGASFGMCPPPTSPLPLPRCRGRGRSKQRAAELLPVRSGSKQAARFRVFARRINFRCSGAAGSSAPCLKASVRLPTPNGNPSHSRRARAKNAAGLAARSGRHGLRSGFEMGGPASPCPAAFREKVYWGALQGEVSLRARFTRSRVVSEKILHS